MKILALIAAWLVLSGFTLTAELRWQDNSNNEEGFLIEQSVNNGPFIALDRVGPDVRSYFVKVTTFKRHCWRVRALNDVGTSGPTNQKCIRRWTVDVQ